LLLYGVILILKQGEIHENQVVQQDVWRPTQHWMWVGKRKPPNPL